MATSTSTFGFIRTLGATVSISVGQAIYSGVSSFDYGRNVIIVLTHVPSLEPSQKAFPGRGPTGLPTGRLELRIESECWEIEGYPCK